MQQLYWVKNSKQNLHCKSEWLVSCKSTLSKPLHGGAYKYAYKKCMQHNFNTSRGHGGKCDLTNDGIVRFVEVSIAPRNQPEVDDRDEVIVEHTLEILNKEI